MSGVFENVLCSSPYVATNANIATALATYGASTDAVQNAALIEREGLRFDGTAGAVIGNGGIPAVGTGDFTLLSIVNSPALSANRRVVGNTGVGPFFSLRDRNDLAVGTVDVTTGSSDIIGSTAGLLEVGNTLLGYVRSGTTGTYYKAFTPWGVVSDATNYSVAANNLGSAGAAGYWNGSLSHTLFFNYALTQAEITALIGRGLVTLPEQRGGSMTSILTGDASTFTSSLGGWAGQSGGTATNTAGKMVITTMNGSYAGAIAPGGFASVYVKGRKYKITLTVSALVGGSSISLVNTGNLNAIAISTSSDLTSPFFPILAGTNTYYFSPSTTCNLLICGLGGSPTVTSATIDDITVTPLGTLFEQDSGQRNAGYMVRDTSGNNLDLILPATGVSVIDPANRGTIRFTTTTSGNQQIGGSQVIIPTNARISSWVINANGTPNVTLGNVSAGAQYRASAAVVSGDNQITLLTPFASTGNLWVNSSTTATLKHTIQWEYIQ